MNDDNPFVELILDATGTVFHIYTVSRVKKTDNPSAGSGELHFILKERHGKLPEELQEEERLREFYRSASLSDGQVSREFFSPAEGRWFRLYPLITGEKSFLMGAVSLKEPETAKNLAVNSLHDTLWLLDAETLGILYISESVQTLLGYSPSEAAALSLEGILTPRSFQLLHDRIRTLAENYDPHKPGKQEYALTEIEQYKKDGSSVWTELASSLYTDAEGRILGVLGVVRDITVRKEAESALRQSEENFRQLAENVTEIFWLEDEKGIIYINQAYEKIFGRSREELYGDPTSFLRAVHPEDRARLDEELKIENGDPLRENSYRIIRPDGEVRWLWSRTFLVDRGWGLPARWAGIAEDITSFRQQQEALREAKTEAESANRAKSAFLATISHEIRTPMNGIIGMAELALTTDLTEEQRDYIDSIQHSAYALLHILNTVLDFSKLEAGRMEIEEIPFDINEPVNMAASAVRPQLLEKRISFSVDTEADIPSPLYGDPTRAQQILTNLLTNAVKFTTEGKISLTTEVLEKKPEEKRLVLRLTVADTGIGIPGDKLELIFDRFSQADSTTTRRFGGTGLGLSISREFALLMGGELSVESEQEKGSRFILTLPFGYNP